jgi:hypothetical protein
VQNLPLVRLGVGSPILAVVSVLLLELVTVGQAVIPVRLQQRRQDRERDHVENIPPLSKVIHPADVTASTARARQIASLNLAIPVVTLLSVTLA